MTTVTETLVSQGWEQYGLDEHEVYANNIDGIPVAVSGNADPRTIKAIEEWARTEHSRRSLGGVAVNSDF